MGRMDERDREPDLPDLLDLQHGVVSRAQCVDLGLGRSEIRRLVRSGRWERLAPSVYGVANHRSTWVRGLWIAHLHAGPDSVVSHESAGRLHRYRQAAARSTIVRNGVVIGRPFQSVT